MGLNKCSQNFHGDRHQCSKELRKEYIDRQIKELQEKRKQLDEEDGSE